MHPSPETEVAIKPDTFILGWHEGFEFKVIPSEVSAVAALKNNTVNLVEHLVIVDETEKLTWKSFHGVGLSGGDLIAMAETHMDGIVKRFLTGLRFEDAAWYFQVDSIKASPRKTVHVDLIVGHQNLFGDLGQIRRCVDDIRKPALIAQEALNRSILR